MFSGIKSKYSKIPVFGPNTLDDVFVLAALKINIQRYGLYIKEEFSKKVKSNIYSKNISDIYINKVKSNVSIFIE